MLTSSGKLQLYNIVIFISESSGVRNRKEEKKLIDNEIIIFPND